MDRHRCRRVGGALVNILFWGALSGWTFAIAFVALSQGQYGWFAIAFVVALIEGVIAYRLADRSGRPMRGGYPE